MLDEQPDILRIPIPDGLFEISEWWPTNSNNKNNVFYY
jgi:hypothetical protein